ncbi:hypothetical protein OSTOST_01096 [Ostertagia ostertagi]
MLSSPTMMVGDYGEGEEMERIQMEQQAIAAAAAQQQPIMAQAGRKRGLVDMGSPQSTEQEKVLLSAVEQLMSDESMPPYLKTIVDYLLDAKEKIELLATENKELSAEIQKLRDENSTLRRSLSVASKPPPHIDLTNPTQLAKLFLGEEEKRWLSSWPAVMRISRPSSFIQIEEVENKTNGIVKSYGQQKQICIGQMELGNRKKKQRRGKRLAFETRDFTTHQAFPVDCRQSNNIDNSHETSWFHTASERMQ